MMMMMMMMMVTTMALIVMISDLVATGELAITETAVAAAWHLFGVIAAAFGPEKTIKHFLGSIIRIFQEMIGGWRSFIC